MRLSGSDLVITPSHSPSLKLNLMDDVFVEIEINIVCSFFPLDETMANINAIS